MATQPLPRQVLVLQALYFESLTRVPDLTKQERERLQPDLRSAKTGHHLWPLGLGGRCPRVPIILYWPAKLIRDWSVIRIKCPGEPLPDVCSRDVGDQLLNFRLHDPEILLLAIQPSARESDILSAVKKQVHAIKKRGGKTRSPGGGRKHSIDRMIEALKAYDDYQPSRNPDSAHKLGERARTFQPIPTDRKGKDTEYFTHTDRGYKLLQLANHMINTARKGSSAWVVTFPSVSEVPIS